MRSRQQGWWSPLPTPTIRLLMDWPIHGLCMRGWIVQKDARTAALLVKTGLAEYVLPGTPPHPDQAQWAQETDRPRVTQS